ncbi:MAG TPA: inositol monophosphatase family protein [Levilinea sp.]|nr:inositol monophosphatase family protein [Levilinea sp.]
MKLDAGDLAMIRSWLVEAGQIALDGFAQAQVHYKADHTPATDVELRIEQQLIKRIQTHFPGQQILTEEQGLEETGSPYCWVLDPIDGTKPYLRGLPVWGISLGLLVGQTPAAGFFYTPVTRDMYWGTPDGAFWNERPLNGSAALALDDPLAFLAVTSEAHRKYEIRYPRLQAYGSAAAHLAYVARGIAVGALTRRAYLWDIAGMLPVLQASGVELAYLSGHPVALERLLRGAQAGDAFLAARPENMARLRGMIKTKRAEGMISDHHQGGK